MIFLNINTKLITISITIFIETLYDIKTFYIIYEKTSI